MRQFPMILKIVITVSYRTFFCFASHWQKLASIVNSIFLGLQELTLLFVPPPDKNSPIEANQFSDLRRSVTIRLSHFTAPLL